MQKGAQVHIEQVCKRVISVQAYGGLSERTDECADL